MSQSVPVAPATGQQSKQKPLKYTYMNYGQSIPPTYQYYQPPPTQMRYTYVPTIVRPQPQYISYAQPIYAAPPVAAPVAAPVLKQGIGCNSNYLKSPLGLLRLLLIPSLIGAVISAALIRTRSYTGYQESSWNTSVWITTLVFACVGLATALLIFLFNVCNCINLNAKVNSPCTILFALFDLAWFAALTVLGAFCARREAVGGFYGTGSSLGEKFNIQGLSQGVFGITAAFCLLSALLHLLSGLLGLLKRKVPLKTIIPVVAKVAKVAKKGKL